MSAVDGKKATSQLTINDVLRRMTEYDLFCNLNTGREYTGFKGLYHFFMLRRRSVSTYGIVYDVTNPDISGHHLLDYLKSLKEEKPSKVVMTSGSFLFMNKPLQGQVVKHLRELSEMGYKVIIYVGNKIDINELFEGSDVKIKVFDREKHFIIHFIKTGYSYNFVMPHTEEKKVRVDMNSKDFKPLNKKLILAYFDRLVAKLDKAIEYDNRAEK